MSQRITLEQIDLPTPCPADWEAMAGDAKSRFCAGCQKSVHDLSAMTRTDAEALLCDAAGRQCVRFERASDGAIKTLDYRPAAPARHGWKSWAGLGVLLAAAAGGVKHYFAPTPAASSSIVQEMGRIAPGPKVQNGK